MTPGSILGWDESQNNPWGFNTGIGTQALSNKYAVQYQQYQTALSAYTLFQPLSTAAKLDAAAKPECSEFAWLRKRVDEVSWNPAKAGSVP